MRVFGKKTCFANLKAFGNLSLQYSPNICGVFTTRTANPLCKAVKLDFFMCDKHIRTLCRQTEVILVITVKKYSAQ